MLSLTEITEQEDRIREWYRQKLATSGYSKDSVELLMRVTPLEDMRMDFMTEKIPILH